MRQRLPTCGTSGHVRWPSCVYTRVPRTKERKILETIRKGRVNVDGADVYGETPLELSRDEDLGGGPLP